MYTNDLHNAYTYETERRKDMMRDAAQSRLAPVNAKGMSRA